ncbi:hypothetical protein HID58_055443, partial [Brassica napus]
SIDSLTRPSIDGGYEYLKNRLITLKLRVDDVYYLLNDIIERLTTYMDELKDEMNMIQRQNTI